MMLLQSFNQISMLQFVGYDSLVNRKVLQAAGHKLKKVICQVGQEGVSYYFFERGDYNIIRGLLMKRLKSSPLMLNFISEHSKFLDSCLINNLRKLNTLSCLSDQEIIELYSELIHMLSDVRSSRLIYMSFLEEILKINIRNVIGSLTRPRELSWEEEAHVDLMNLSKYYSEYASNRYLELYGALGVDRSSLRSRLNEVSFPDNELKEIESERSRILDEQKRLLAQLPHEKLFFESLQILNYFNDRDKRIRSITGYRFNELLYPELSRRSGISHECFRILMPFELIDAFRKKKVDMAEIEKRNQHFSLVFDEKTKVLSGDESVDFSKSLRDIP